MNGLSKETPLFRPALMDSRLSGSKLTCGFCKADFNSLEALQLHVQVIHVPVLPLNGNSSPSPNMAPSGSSSQLRPTSGGLMSKSGNTTVFSCEYCTLIFSSVHALQKHTLSVHSYGDLGAGKGIGEPVFCPHCTMGFNGTSSLAEHIRNVHESGLDSSRSDRRRSRSPIRTESPKNSKMVNGKVKTPDDAARSSSKTRQDASLFNGTAPASQFAHPGTLLCSQCNAGFQDFESFRAHLKTHLDAVVLKFNCPECDEEFHSEDRLDAHLATHFLSTATEYGCQSCLKLFSKPDELQKHLMDLHAYHLYRCSLCKEVFDSRVAIQVHFSCKHSNECRLFRCTTCVAAVFRSLVEFQVHVRLAHLMQAKNQQHPFRCLLCDHSFANELQLQLHAATHKKPFVCTFCDEAFHVEFLLDKHLQTRHSGESPGRSKDNGNVNGAASGETTGSSATDMAQNLSMKSRSRSESVSLNQSEDSSGLGGSTNRKELKCDICDATFPSDNALSNHRRQAHNIRTSGSQRSGQTTLSLYCAYCSESCKSRTELENHMKAHTVSPSKHKCNICDEICPSATTLAEHKLTHCKLVSGISCFVCRSSLKSEEQFYSHFQQHNNQSASGGGGSQGGWPFPCVICRQSLASDVEVQMHAKFHLQKVFGEVPNAIGDLLFPCCVCGRRFESHHLIITGKQDCGHTYMCKDCFHSKSAAVGALVAAAAAAAANRESSSTVKDGRTSPGDLRCVDCQVKFESLPELESHRLTTHNKTYQCIKCQISFGTEAEIQEHVTTHVLQEGTEHECRLCQRVFDSPAKLQCHLIEHTFEGCSSYTCYLCSAIFTSPHVIQQHMLEHGLNSRPYDCGQCHQRFFFRAELDHHSFLHDRDAMDTDEKPSVISESLSFRCDECGENFSSASNLTTHRSKHHPRNSESPTVGGSSEGPVKCSLCPMSFHTSIEMQDHFFNTHGEELSSEKKDSAEASKQGKPYACPVCGKRFAHRENRKAHVKLHSDSKPYLCLFCDQTFSRRSRLRDHVKSIHQSPTTSATSHDCDSCSGTFASVQLLRLHLTEVHQRTYLHTCAVCKDLFEDSDQLTSHERECHDSAKPVVVEDEMAEVTEEALPPSPGQCSVASSTDRESKPVEANSDHESAKNDPEPMDETIPQDVQEIANSPPSNPSTVAEIAA